jgi:hypothetical protein
LVGLWFDGDGTTDDDVVDDGDGATTMAKARRDATTRTNAQRATTSTMMATARRATTRTNAQ